MRTAQLRLWLALAARPELGSVLLVPRALRQVAQAQRRAETAETAPTRPTSGVAAARRAGAEGQLALPTALRRAAAADMAASLVGLVPAAGPQWPKPSANSARQATAATAQTRA